MRIVFQNIGLKKINKVVESKDLLGFECVHDLIMAELDMHLPEKGELELVPIDGQDFFVADRFTVVHHDTSFCARGMGTVLVVN